MKARLIMASPAQLMDVLSRTTGLPLATVVDLDRRLVTAGLRTKGGRGFSVAQMTPLDAARLLTAILASPLANQAVEAVQRYARTRVYADRSNDKHFAATQLDDLATLPARHGFVDALAALIASVATGELAKLIAATEDGSAPSIEVFAFTRATRGRIRIARLPSGHTASIEYIPIPAAQKPARAGKSGPRRRGAADAEIGDLEQSRRVTERTILSIATLLKEGEPACPP
jgi:hypothetical protein